MPKFPVDAPKEKVVRTLEILGFQIVREGNHIAMVRRNPDGTRTPLTMPNHRTIKGSTLRTIIQPEWDFSRRIHGGIREGMSSMVGNLSISGMFLVDVPPPALADIGI